MTDLQIKVISPKALAKVVELSSASPLGHALRSEVARELGLSFDNALEIIRYLHGKGYVKIGETINDYWVKIAES